MMTKASSKLLIEYLISRNLLKSEGIIKAFKAINREDFVLNKFLSQAYDDRPLPIGESQTISQPSTVAFMIELLSPRQGESVLDIGSGSGWTTALLAFIVGEKGAVMGLELIPKLVDFGIKNLDKYNFSNARIIQATPGILGLPDKKFDRILVSASAREFPEELLPQLKNKGVMVVPVRNSIYRVEKNSIGRIKKVEYPGFVFVPLKYS